MHPYITDVTSHLQSSFIDRMSPKIKEERKALDI